jgi:hypothetical protein
LRHAQIFVARARETEETRHELRLFYAKKAREAVDAFIAEEVHAANSKPTQDSNHLSWAKIGQILGLSKTAVFTKYGGKK